ncbi:MAG: dephospho-CoA kinase [Christensenellaceae bacterium]|nr:dephospho-CoA kinase [Christensenellaceae bacterium]
MNALIGITGGIGSGKSAMTQDLRARGYFVVCADETAREVVRPGEPGAKALLAEYGEGFSFRTARWTERSGQLTYSATRSAWSGSTACYIPSSSSACLSKRREETALFSWMRRC